MAKNEQTAAESTDQDQGNLIQQVATLKKLALLLLLACLGLSLCFNWYVVAHNQKQQERIDAYAAQLRNQANREQSLFRLLTDLRSLARFNEDLRRVLVRHGVLQANAAPAGPTPQAGQGSSTQGQAAP